MERLVCTAVLATCLFIAAGEPIFALPVEKKCTTMNQTTTQETKPSLVPESTEVLYRHFNSTNRRKLGDFRECAPCTCCTDETRRFCFLTVCCYNINCSLRKVPFGLCSFTPVSCNCFGCSH